MDVLGDAKSDWNDVDSHDEITAEEESEYMLHTLEYFASRTVYNHWRVSQVGIRNRLRIDNISSFI